MTKKKKQQREKQTRQKKEEITTIKKNCEPKYLQIEHISLNLTFWQSP